MPDREKVIKGLEHCIRKPRNSHDNPCDGCPYDKKGNFECGKLMVDALKLLKEQEERKNFKVADLFRQFTDDVKTLTEETSAQEHKEGEAG